MKLIDEWDQVLKKAWSARLMILAAVLSGAEVIVPLFSDVMPRGVFAVLSMVTVAGAFIARFVVQENLHGDE